MTSKHIIVACGPLGKKVFFDGKRVFDTDRKCAKEYPSQAAALKAAESLDMPNGWRLELHSIAVRKNPRKKPRRKKRGGNRLAKAYEDVVKAVRKGDITPEQGLKILKKNPIQEPLKEARKLFRTFTGHHAKTTKRVDIPPFHGPALTVGPVLGIIYRAKRDGKSDDYLHEFAQGARPTLLSSYDGRSLHLTGGAYRFTERGITDKKRPRGRRSKPNASRPRRRGKSLPA